MSITSRLANKMSRGGQTEEDGKSWAKPVVRIATAGVSLGIALIIISTAIVTGFQSEIKDLVIGFSSHIQIIPSSTENSGVLIDQTLLKEISLIENVELVAPLHQRPGLVETSNSIKGVSIKGLDFSYGDSSFPSDTSLLSTALKHGALPRGHNDILISKPLANRLELEIGDRLSLYIVVKNEDVKPRAVVICGIYETGLLEYDEKFVFTNCTLLQEASDRGVQAVIVIEDDIVNGKVFGKDEYGKKPEGYWEPHHPYLLSSISDTLTTFFWIAGESAVSDTATLNFINGTWIALSGKGSSQVFSDGYEVFISDLEATSYIEEQIIFTLPFDTPTRLRTSKVFESNREIFNWLGMLDINVAIIIGLMILISIINMVSALLIVILERRTEVGILKALGMDDSSVIQLFVMYSASIIGVGFLVGNVLGLGICFLQSSTGLLSLDPAAYYLSEVPILIDFSQLLIIELGAFGFCVLAMFIPALYSTRILPSDALRIKQ